MRLYTGPLCTHTHCSIVDVLQAPSANRWPATVAAATAGCRIRVAMQLSHPWLAGMEAWSVMDLSWPILCCSLCDGG